MRRSGRTLALMPGCAAVVLLLGGCVPQAEYSATISDYRGASDKLGSASEALFAHANAVEAESFIDTQSFERQPLSQTTIQGRAILSDEGLRLRRDAIAALSAYTLALAAVATGKTEDQIAADAATAGTGLAGLTGDLQAAIAKDNPEVKTTDYSGVITAASAAGELIQLLEKHRNRAELEASLRKNDPAMKALFVMIGADAERVFTRQRLGLQNRGDVLFGGYAKAIALAPPEDAYVLELSDRIKRFRRDTEVLGRSDPQPVFAAWSSAHDELVTVLLEGGGPAAQKKSLGKLVSDVGAFAAEVEPLAGNLETLAQSF